MDRQAGIWPRGRQGNSSDPGPQSHPSSSSPTPSCMTGPHGAEQRWPQHLAAAAHRTSGSRRWVGARSGAGSPPWRPGPDGRCCHCGTRSRRGSCCSGTARRRDSAQVPRTQSAGMGRRIGSSLAGKGAQANPTWQDRARDIGRGEEGTGSRGAWLNVATEQIHSGCSHLRQWLSCPQPQF